LEKIVEKVTATDAKNKFGMLIDMAQKSPVAIEKQGRSVAVIISSAEYARLEEIEDSYWIMQANAAEQSGFLSIKESEEFLKNLGE
jgi:prevent-host-death family protein